LHRTASPPTPTRKASHVEPAASRVDSSPASRLDTESSDTHNADEDGDEQVQIRLDNAYPGATNSINSVHQRKWFLSLDRAACGFRPTDETAFGRRLWERPKQPEPANDSSLAAGFPSFHVRGRDFETSILTGRTAAQVAADEGLVGYRPRGGWTAVLE
jgi:hypothetical protein